MVTAKRRYRTFVPTSGLAQYDGLGNYIEDRQYLDWDYDPLSDAATEEFDDLQLDFADVPNDTESGLRLVELSLALAGVPNASDTAGTPYLQVWTGPNQTGDEFAIILENTAFSASPGALQARAYTGSGKIDFSNAQLAAEGVVTVYLSGIVSHSFDSALEKAEIRQEIKATQERLDLVAGGGGDQAITFVATAAETIDDESIGYIGTNTLLYQLDDPSDLAQVTTAVYVVDGGAAGSSITCYLQGRVEVDAGILPLPINKPIRVGNNFKPTYHGDLTNPIVTGDWIKEIGRSYDGTDLWLRIQTPPTARK